MTDTIFITGVVIHARHGVMDHETEVGQRFVIDLELSHRSFRFLAHRPPGRHGVLFQCGRRPRPRRSRTPITSCWNAPPAPSPTPFWPRLPASAPSRSPFTSRTRRSPRSSRTSAWFSPARENRPDMADVLIALGGNVGDVRSIFQKAIANICGMTQAALLARSSDYLTPPWGEEPQDRFINACIEIETSLDPARAAVHPAQNREKVRPRPRPGKTLGSAHPRPRSDRL